MFCEDLCGFEGFYQGAIIAMIEIRCWRFPEGSEQSLLSKGVHRLRQVLWTSKMVLGRLATSAVVVPSASSKHLWLFSLGFNASGRLRGLVRAPGYLLKA